MVHRHTGPYFYNWTLHILKLVFKGCRKTGPRNDAYIFKQYFFSSRHASRRVGFVGSKLTIYQAGCWSLLHIKCKGSKQLGTREKRLWTNVSRRSASITSSSSTSGSIISVPSAMMIFSNQIDLRAATEG